MSTLLKFGNLLVRGSNGKLMGMPSTPPTPVFTDGIKMEISTDHQSNMIPFVAYGFKYQDTSYIEQIATVTNVEGASAEALSKYQSQSMQWIDYSDAVQFNSSNPVVVYLDIQSMIYSLTFTVPSIPYIGDGNQFIAEVYRYIDGEVASHKTVYGDAYSPGAQPRFWTDRF